MFDKILEWIDKVIDSPTPHEFWSEIDEIADEISLQGHVELPRSEVSDIDLVFGDTGTVVVVGNNRAWESLSNREIEDLIMAELLNEMEPINPDRLPYDPREGF